MSDLDEAQLEAWLAANVAGFAGPITVTKFAGGQSNPTYRIDAGSGAYVLRRKPFGPILPSAHAVDREHRLIEALHPTGFPVARPYGLCEDDTVIGSAFYIMEMVEGRTLWDGSLPDMAPGERTATYDAITDTLAALHRIDPDAVGLGDYGKPGNYFERQVGRWSKQYKASQTDDLPEMEKLIAFLPRTVPEQTRTSIVHGDFRIDNMIFAPAEPSVLAVLDWELSTLGDPLADFSYFLMSWVTEPESRSGVMGLTGPDTGIPTLEQVVDRYCAATGRDGVPDLDWYFSYNLFRLAGIVQGIKKRMIDGNASSDNAAATVARLPGLVAASWDFARRAGAPA
ncbi:phosphotransferase family protein [Sphingomonas sp. HF-S3]|uniref:Phosphotransferase family protein n=1 Tax=Sphingomonas rustica TaxID=3103142 RepID=A0ABV0B6Y6_9SPHN